MSRMELAIQERHTVRKYMDKEIPYSFITVIKERVETLNKKNNTSISLVTDNKHGFTPFFRLILAKGVRNYFILEGPQSEHLAEDIGYAGADLMLFAQTLGLNTWWVGGTYNKISIRKLSKGKHVLGIITLGYGVTQGHPHKSKSIDEVSSYSGIMPIWFRQGVEAALLAPTAFNAQPFFIKGNGNHVSLTVTGGLMSKIDLGIVRYFFEIGAGRENFTWDD